MKIYFDTCSLHRPSDDKAQLRVAMEAEAMLRLLEQCEFGGLTLVSSEALELEVGRNPDTEKREQAESFLALNRSLVPTGDDIKLRAKVLEKRGFEPLDALHLASAESGNCDYLCTCDNSFLKRSRRQTDLKTKVISPLELADEVLP